MAENKGNFFVHRPIVAMVIAIVIVIVGVVSMIGLPIEQYPSLVINEERYTGLNDVDILFPIICESYSNKPDACKEWENDNKTRDGPQKALPSSKDTLASGRWRKRTSLHYSKRCDGQVR